MSKFWIRWSLSILTFRYLSKTEIFYGLPTLDNLNQEKRNISAVNGQLHCLKPQQNIRMNWYKIQLSERDLISMGLPYFIPILLTQTQQANDSTN